MKHVLLTGAAGFIGYSVTKMLLDQGHRVTGVDNLNDYYDVSLKQDRLQRLMVHPNFRFYHVDISDLRSMESIFNTQTFTHVCHLAAQAGVRYSLTHPHVYQKSNMEGFQNVIELSKQTKVSNFVYASSSSVYGGNTKIPFSETDPVDHPVSLYAATKRSNELVAYTYSHLHALPCTGLRFFTVYGPWGRPDMALFSFVRAIMNDAEINVHGMGHMKRDFTYVDDIVKGVLASLDHAASYEIFNLGNNQPIELAYFIQCIEKCIGKVAKKKYVPMIQGEVVTTYADISHAKAKLGFDPRTAIETGVERFVEWYRDYYKIR